MKKTKLTRSLLAACSIVALTAVMYGCVHDGGDDTATDETDVMEPMEPDPDPYADELAAARTAATAAETAAMTASGNAATSATAAATATANLATSQTGATAGGLAKEAADAAAMAKTAYEHAKTAAAAAAAATTVTAAVAAQSAAERAKGHAETHATTAMEKSMAAVEAAKGELMIVETVKSVGGSSVDATTGRTAVTTGSGAAEKTVITGLLSEPVTMGVTTDGREAVAAVLTGTPVSYVSPRVNAAMRADVKIGKMLDTSDDKARLAIVTHYAGTKTVEVFAEDDAADLVGRLETDGRIRGAGADNSFETAADDTFTTLSPVGEYYLATGGDTADAIEPMGRTTADPPEQAGDTVAATAKPQMVYTYEAEDDDNDATDETRYVRLQVSSSEAGVTTVTYQHVNIHFLVDQDGDGADDSVEVQARIPERAAYEHVHFGAWASLGAAKANGDQTPSGLGIGFVQSIGDAGMTGADMPNNGTASYVGNWAGTIQAADTDGDGGFSMTTGAATVTANFAKDKDGLVAALTGLATLTGDITGNTFSGTKAAATGGGLEIGGTFTGSFSGGFYGPKADETAGVFSFTSAGDTAGGFAGAFGGQRQAD